MGASELLKAIDMPLEMANKIAPIGGFGTEIGMLLDVDTFEAGAARLHERLAPDEDGAKILSAMIEAATMSAREYAARGIPKEIYFATMECFARFVKERLEGYGDCAFDRWWWTGRQTSLKLFRLGALEYEMCEEAAGREVSIHIPSHADLSAEEVERSLRMAAAFFGKYFPAYGGVPYTCTSWMLHPAFVPLLGPASRIAAFAARFDIENTWETDDFIFFIFKRNDIAPEDFPENTSLQRAVKKIVLNGGRLGIARGRLRKEAR